MVIEVAQKYLVSDQCVIGNVVDFVKFIGLVQKWLKVFFLFVGLDEFVIRVVLLLYDEMKYVKDLVLVMMEVKVIELLVECGEWVKKKLSGDEIKVYEKYMMEGVKGLIK